MVAPRIGSLISVDLGFSTDPNSEDCHPGFGAEIGPSDGDEFFWFEA